MSGSDPAGLQAVRVLEFPLDVYQRSTEAFEGLRREFVLVSMRTPEAAHVPARLLQLVDALTDEYSGMNDEPDQLRDAAIERGQTVLDELVYHVPPQVADACIALNGMLDEADVFCRNGGVLLSLATPSEAVAFRRWYLGEFVAQVQGQPPVPWSQVDQQALLRQPALRGAPGA